MPQMSPLLWLNLMVMFLIGFYIFYSITHYLSLPLKIEKGSKIKSFSQNIWKW